VKPSVVLHMLDVGFFSLCSSVIFYDCSFRIFFKIFACWFIRDTYLQGHDQKCSLLCPVLSLSLLFPHCGTSATDLVSLSFSIDRTLWYITFRIHCHKFLFSLFYIFTLRMKQVYLKCVWHNLQHHFHYTCTHPTNQWLLENTGVMICRVLGPLDINDIHHLQCAWVFLPLAQVWVCYNSFRCTLTSHHPVFLGTVMRHINILLGNIHSS
jgi:hypothetical protein